MVDMWREVQDDHASIPEMVEALRARDCNKTASKILKEFKKEIKCYCGKTLEERFGQWRNDVHKGREYYECQNKQKGPDNHYR